MKNALISKAYNHGIDSLNTAEIQILDTLIRDYYHNTALPAKLDNKLREKVIKEMKEGG